MNDIFFRQFRVYDHDRKEYIDSNDVVMSPTGEIKWICSVSIDNTEVVLEKLEGRFTVELSTGCRDRSGKLIYEGDICDDHGTLYVIRRDEAYGVAPHLQPFKADDPEYGNWSYEGGMPNSTADPIHGVDIVGNIHETPYLVKGLEA